MSTTRHIAEVTDPITGETTTLSASSALELEQLITDHLEVDYPSSENTAADRADEASSAPALSGAPDSTPPRAQLARPDARHRTPPASPARPRGNRHD